MKKIISAALVLLLILSLTACGTKPATDRSSDFYGEIVKNNGVAEMPITGVKDGELYRYSGASMVMDDDMKKYYAFEGVLEYLAEQGQFEIGDERWGIMTDALPEDTSNLTDAQIEQLQNEAVYNYYTSKAGITLTDAERKTIEDAAIAQTEKDRALAEIDNMKMELEVAGFNTADLGNFAFTTSQMMVHAYGIGIFMPAEGKTEAVVASCNSFVEKKQQEFEMYLVDQYEIAKADQVKTMKTGEVVLVMTEYAADVMTAIETALAK